MPQEPEPKRRKVRKGTQSCWECKRRKIKCSFTSESGDAGGAGQGDICDRCKRRGTRCITQEFADRPSPAVNFYQLEDRIQRLEDYLNLPGGSGADNDVGDEAQSEFSPEKEDGVEKSLPVARAPSPDFSSLSGVPLLPCGKPSPLYRHLVSLWPSQGDLKKLLGRGSIPHCLFDGGVASLYRGNLEYDARALQTLIRAPPGPGSHPVLVALKLLNLGLVLQGLPSYATNDIKCRDMVRQVIETTASLVTRNDEMVDSVTGVECHLLESICLNNSGQFRRSWLAARRAMTLAVAIGLSGPQQHNNKSNSPTGADTNYTMETTTDAEALWFRLVYYDRYLSFMLGLPQAFAETNMNNRTMADITATLIHDQQQATPTPTSTPKPTIPTAACPPRQRLVRLNALVAGRILVRNQTYSNPSANPEEETARIDKILQSAASSMPARWWLLPTISNSRKSNSWLWTIPTDREYGDADTAAVDQIHRLRTQFTFYCLLLQLHLPALVDIGWGHRQYHRQNRNSSGNNNRIPQTSRSASTAAHAARELLRRYVAFSSSSSLLPAMADAGEGGRGAGSWRPMAYFRGMDVFAFVSCVALCVVHVRGLYPPELVSGADGSVFSASASETPSSASGCYGYAAGSCFSSVGGMDFDPHQRLSDRGLLERVAEVVKESGGSGEGTEKEGEEREVGDTLMGRIAEALREVLRVEEDAVRCSSLAGAWGSGDDENNLMGEGYKNQYFYEVKFKAGGQEDKSSTAVEPEKGGYHSLGTEGQLEIILPSLGKVILEKKERMKGAMGDGQPGEAIKRKDLHAEDDEAGGGWSLGGGQFGGIGQDGTAAGQSWGQWGEGYVPTTYTTTTGIWQNDEQCILNLGQKGRMAGLDVGTWDTSFTGDLSAFQGEFPI